MGLRATRGDLPVWRIRKGKGNRAVILFYADNEGSC
jgi:hypothetical protein